MADGNGKCSQKSCQSNDPGIMAQLAKYPMLQQQYPIVGHKGEQVSTRGALISRQLFESMHLQLTGPSTMSEFCDSVVRLHHRHFYDHQGLYLHQTARKAPCGKATHNGVGVALPTTNGTGVVVTTTNGTAASKGIYDVLITNKPANNTGVANKTTAGNVAINSRVAEPRTARGKAQGPLLKLWGGKFAGGGNIAGGVGKSAKDSGSHACRDVRGATLQNSINNVAKPAHAASNKAGTSTACVNDCQAVEGMAT
jgi:hypothetical protein